MRAALPALSEACEKAGRPMARVIPFGTVPSEEKLAYYAEMGIEEVVLSLPSAPADRVLPVLDDYAGFITV
nr:hypothetical protein GCM10020093_101430 [Planobispora longispora]